MKKLVMFAIIGWMSVLAVQAQVVALHGGYAFEINKGVHPDRTHFAIDLYEGHGAFGLGLEFPSNYDPRFEINLHGGVNFLWDNFMLSPQAELAYNHGKSTVELATSKPSSGVSIGAGLIANYRIVGPLGAFMKVRWMSPVGFEPVTFGPGGTTSFAVGLTMFWFR